VLDLLHVFGVRWSFTRLTDDRDPSGEPATLRTLGLDFTGCGASFGALNPDLVFAPGTLPGHWDLLSSGPPDVQDCPPTGTNLNPCKTKTYLSKSS
jgi:hypothetical protein